jgi:DNA-binding CsgD family transcriptional regulator/predicted nucleic acid-binding Zn ribbon protein
MSREPSRTCFVCARPLRVEPKLSVIGRENKCGRTPRIQFHRKCGLRLGAIVLGAMTVSEECQPEVKPPSEDASRAIAKAGLSRREVQVLRELIAGDTNQEIARRLNMNAEYVKQIVSEILSKLEVRSRTGAAVLAVRMGLVETRSDET